MDPAAAVGVMDFSHAPPGVVLMSGPARTPHSRHAYRKESRIDEPPRGQRRPRLPRLTCVRAGRRAEGQLSSTPSMSYPSATLLMRPMSGAAVEETDLRRALACHPRGPRPTRRRSCRAGPGAPGHRRGASRACRLRVPALLRQLGDERGNKVLFLSHCLLDEDVRYLDSAFRSGWPASAVESASQPSGLGLIPVMAGSAARAGHWHAVCVRRCKSARQALLASGVLRGTITSEHPAAGSSAPTNPPNVASRSGP